MQVRGPGGKTTLDLRTNSLFTLGLDKSVYLMAVATTTSVNILAVDQQHTDGPPVFVFGEDETKPNERQLGVIVMHNNLWIAELRKPETYISLGRVCLFKQGDLQL